MKSLSVIILCHKNEYIGAVIERVKEQARGIDEIIVVNDGDPENLPTLAGYGARALQAEKSGNRAQNRNLAAAKARGDILVFIDGDILVEDGALDKLRDIDYKNISGACAAVAAMQVVPEEAAVILKDFNGRDWSRERGFDLFHRVFPDSRAGTKNLPWNRFYSAICAVPRDKFFAAGAFDENLSGWGGEDIDLGYRLSALGSLVFEQSIRGIHIPHPRNQRENELTGRKNMYAMLAKYRNRDMEELLSFACLSRAREALDIVIEKMRGLPQPYDLKAEKAGGLFFSVVSAERPNGYISYISDGVLFEEEFLGLALPFEDGRFEKSVTDTRIFCYPVGLAARIIQELLRVSPVLHVKKIDYDTDIPWGDTQDKFRHIFCYYKTIQFCDSYGDFNIKDVGDSFVITLL